MTREGRARGISGGALHEPGCRRCASTVGSALRDGVRRFVGLFVTVLALAGCSANRPPAAVKPHPIPPVFVPPAVLSPVPVQSTEPRIMLGIDVLEAENFAPLRGLRIGLLTHPAGVDRRGVSTIEVLRHAPGIRLVALYGVEHGVYGEYSAGTLYPDRKDPRTGLMVYSLYNGRTHEPTAAQLKPIDALVIDLQDIGTRSYTFISAMKAAMQGCFKHGKEVIVLDRPNPLGGLKVDGPLLDTQWAVNNYVGAFPVPYVHGMTIGELALMAKNLRPPTGLAVSDAERLKGKLTVIRMKGWTRSMRWPETGLKWIPTSPFITSFAAVEGYPMVGLGTYRDPKLNFEIGFFHGIGSQFPFRALTFRAAGVDVVENRLQRLDLPGLRFEKVTVKQYGRPASGVYVEITDYDAWQPTELGFCLMKLACQLSRANPFARARGRDPRGFLRLLGSTEFYRDLAANGARVDLTRWLQLWHKQDRIFQQESRRYWLYY